MFRPGFITIIESLEKWSLQTETASWNDLAQDMLMKASEKPESN
jgi:hypothetical protein